MGLLYLDSKPDLLTLDSRSEEPKIDNGSPIAHAGIIVELDCARALGIKRYSLATRESCVRRQVQLNHSTNNANRPGASATMSRGDAARGM